MVPRFLCKGFLRVEFSGRTALTQNLYVSQNHSSLVFAKYLSSKLSEDSFTVSYLTNEWGFSPKSALSASKYVHFDTPERLTSFMSFLKSRGFSDSQAKRLIGKFPRLLVYADPEETISPKMEFLISKGISSSDLAKALSNNPQVLARSLTKQIIPTYDFFKNLLGSDDKVLSAIRRFADILTHDPQSFVVPNIAILQEYGLPKSNIEFLITAQPRDFIVKPARFKEIVEEVSEMCINPSSKTFVIAVSAKLSMSKSTWDGKISVFKMFGWSEDEIFLAFMKCPRCMMLSEDNLKSKLYYFLNEMGWGSSVMFQRPSLLGLSLKKRLVPRYSMFKAMVSKGLIKGRLNYKAVLLTSEREFLQKFVACHEGEAPHLLKLYQQILESSQKFEE